MIGALVTLWWLGGCSIFPSEAVLPGSGSAGAGAIAEGGSANAGSGGELGGEGGTLAVGGANVALAGDSAGGSMDSGGGEAGSPDHAGAGGTGGCLRTPIERVATFTDDTWIEASKPGATHGDDGLLYVDAPGERRALFSMLVPAAPAGAVLISAHVTLTLLENADASRSERPLELHVLTHVVDESRTSWNNWGNGNLRKWTTPGGDFGPAIAEALLPASSSAGQLTFDVSRALGEIFSDQAVELSLIALDVASPAEAPSELAFGSTEGDASLAPSLVVQYCPL